jgi:hypothetical protein
MQEYVLLSTINTWNEVLSVNNRPFLNLLPILLQGLAAILMRHLRDVEAFSGQLSAISYQITNIIWRRLPLRAHACKECRYKEWSKIMDGQLFNQTTLNIFQR